MRRLEYIRRGELRHVDAPMPSLQSDGDAIVQPVAATTCDLDRAIIAGLTPFEGPFALGHEAVGEVIEMGDGVLGIAPGQLVVVPPLGGDFGGLFSDAVRVPWADHALVPLPDGVSARAAASASDNLTDAYRAVAPALREAPGAEVLVIGGTGSIGVYAVAFARALGASAVAYVDRHEPDAVAIARELGAEILGQPPAGREFKLTVDASGRPAGLRAALAATGSYGRCHSFGIYFEDVPLPLASMFMQGVTLSTGRPDVRPSIPDVLALLADGTVDPVPVFSDVVTFDEAPTALAQGLRKPVVVRGEY